MACAVVARSHRRSQGRREEPHPRSRGDASDCGGGQPYGRAIQSRPPRRRARSQVFGRIHQSNWQGQRCHGPRERCYRRYEEARTYLASEGLPEQFDLFNVMGCKVSKKKAVMPEFGVGYPVGLVVWARLEGL